MGEKEGEQEEEGDGSGVSRSSERRTSHRTIHTPSLIYWTEVPFPSSLSRSMLALRQKRRRHFPSSSSPFLVVRQVVFNTRRIGEEEPSVRQRKGRKGLGSRLHIHEHSHTKDFNAIIDSIPFLITE